jgi:methyltransferase family protein
VNRPDHWRTISQQWSRVGSPLRPGVDDARHFAELLKLDRAAPFRGLILGVTPELYRLPWPNGSTVLAADRSPEMIAAIWPGPIKTAHVADWLELPFADGTFDVVLCDGGSHLLGYPTDHARLSNSLNRVLANGGCFALRLFALPQRAETSAEIWQDLQAGRIANFHVFKLRMVMAKQSTPTQGVVLSQVYDTILGMAGGRLSSLSDQTDWPFEQVATLDSYRNSSNVYHFLTEDKSVAAITASHRFSLEDRREGNYPLGERCPTLLFRKS